MQEPENTKKTSIQFGKETIITSKTISNMSNYASTSSSDKAECITTSTTLPTPITFQPTLELKGKIQEHVRKDKFLQQIGHIPTPGDGINTSMNRSGGVRDVKRGVKRLREEEIEKERSRLGEGEGTNRERTTQRMVRFIQTFRGLVNESGN
jgi:hypothetical protein